MYGFCQKFYTKQINYTSVKNRKLKAPYTADTYVVFKYCNH